MNTDRESFRGHDPPAGSILFLVVSYINFFLNQKTLIELETSLSSLGHDPLIGNLFGVTTLQLGNHQPHPSTQPLRRLGVLRNQQWVTTPPIGKPFWGSRPPVGESPLSSLRRRRVLRNRHRSAGVTTHRLGESFGGHDPQSGNPPHATQTTPSVEKSTPIGGGHDPPTGGIYFGVTTHQREDCCLFFFYSPKRDVERILKRRPEEQKKKKNEKNEKKKKKKKKNENEKKKKKKKKGRLRISFTPILLPVFGSKEARKRRNEGTRERGREDARTRGSE